MPIAFEELEGSPRVQVNEQGTTALRVFRVDWDDWKPFVRELLGSFRFVGQISYFVPPISFPGLSNMIVTDLVVDPFDPESPDHTPNISLAARTNRYSGGARVTATYRALFDELRPSRPDLPSVPEGTYLTYAADVGAERQMIPGRAWRWSTGLADDFVPDDVNPGLLLPSDEFTLRWQRVPRPPWNAIRRVRGAVNAAPFLGAPPGTVLFLGARVSRRFQFVEDLGFWTLEYRFAESAKRLSDGVTPVGWNYFFRENAFAGEHWVPIVDRDGNPPYASANFLELFTFE